MTSPADIVTARPDGLFVPGTGLVKRIDTLREDRATDDPPADRAAAVHAIGEARARLRGGPLRAS